MNEIYRNEQIGINMQEKANMIWNIADMFPWFCLSVLFEAL